MRSLKAILLTTLLLLPLFAQNEDEDLQKALQNLVILMEKSASSLKELSSDEQKAIPEEQNSFQLYYRVVQNSLSVKPRNDLLIKTQIQYRLLRTKDVPYSTILVLVRDGKVELYGKVHSQKTAEKILDIALHTKGVKQVTSYLIIKKPAKLLL